MLPYAKIESLMKMYYLLYSDWQYISCNLAHIFSFPPWCYQSRHVTLVWRKVERFGLYNSRVNAKEFDDNQRNFQFCFNGLQKDRPIDFHTRKVYKSYYINIIIESINNSYLKPKEKTGYTCVISILTLTNSFLNCVGGLDE